jgi:hypothetical protein
VTSNEVILKQSQNLSASAVCSTSVKDIILKTFTVNTVYTFRYSLLKESTSPPIKLKSNLRGLAIFPSRCKGPKTRTPRPENKAIFGPD